MEDHPRRCGENMSIATLYNKLTGSPPQVRGKLSPSHGSTFAHRITPADAGKTYMYQVKRKPPTDHPRGCGENRNKCEGDVEQLGSPPRMRGKLLGLPKAYFRTRITPAEAGKTGHPCAGGNMQVGSPPRMRGKPLGALLVAFGIRITPADAGKTYQRGRS